MKRSEWYTLVDDARATMQIEFFRGMAFLHATFRMPFSAMRIARTIFPEVKLALRRIGNKRVHVVIPEGDAKLHRFERAFGFVDEKRHGGYILMGQDC